MRTSLTNRVLDSAELHLGDIVFLRDREGWFDASAHQVTRIEGDILETLIPAGGGDPAALFRFRRIAFGVFQSIDHPDYPGAPIGLNVTLRPHRSYR